MVASESVDIPNVIVAKDKSRRLRLIDTLLQEGQRIVVDATHSTRNSRAELIRLAHKYNYPVRIFWLSRPGRYYNDLRERPTPEVALRTYTKYFEMPTPEEGVEIVRLV